jgi:N-acetylmuramoyl-L-alanine amidase
MRGMALRSVLSLLTVLAALLGGAAAFAAKVTVQDVRVWAGPNSTRVVLDLSGPAEHNVMTLRNPDRVVVDIPSASASDSVRALPRDQGFIKQVRLGEQGNGNLRVVIDLAADAKPKTFPVGPSGSYGHRLVIDLEPASTSSASAQAPKQQVPTVVKSAADARGRDIIIAIDAGHGGQDPGSIGKRGTLEKNVTLQIARRLKERIDREPGMRAVLTRDGDYFVKLRDRIDRARKAQADMFISIHADAYHDRSVVGSSVYVLSARGASDESARWLADRENASDLVGGVSLDDKDDVLRSVLLDLSQSASMSASIAAAEKVMDSLYSMGNITRRGVKQAGFLVLKAPDIPSMLVETAFISNPTEEARLINPTHQQRLAEAILNGVRAYFYSSPPPGTLIASMRAKSGDRAVVANNPKSAGDAAVGTSH